MDQAFGGREPATRPAVFSFTGTAKEYFGIWIVNLFLSIITLGIYTAWAKVRRLRYFYGNTWLDGHNFEYHARPVQILIGRIIVVGVLIVANLLAEFFPLAALLLLIPYFLAFPWLINKAFEFNARMSSYRNVRFGFSGSYFSALWVFVVLPLVVPIVFGLLGLVFYYAGEQEAFVFDPVSNELFLSAMGLVFLLAYVLFIPYISKQANSYIANGMRFGSARMSADIHLSSLYRNLGVAILAVLGALMIIVALGFGVYLISGEGADAVNFGMIQLGIMVLYLSVPFAYLVYAAGVRNIAFNATSIEGGHDLKSGVPRFGYAWVIISNFIVSVLTIGLMIPWAAIRTWRYLSNYTAVETSVGFDQFVADQEAQGNVAAAEYLDIDGIDFGP